MTRVSISHRDERGMIGLAPASITLAVVLLAALARFGSGVVAQARADAAADAAALAAADQLALGAGAPAAGQAARSTASDNGARVVRCDCSGIAAEVVVEVRPPLPLGPIAPAVRGVARAELDPGAAISGSGGSRRRAGRRTTMPRSPRG
jgi:secretion/DNA translocation related TadE-like protein